MIKAAFHMWVALLIDMMTQFTQIIFGMCGGGEGAMIYLGIYPWWPNLALNFCQPLPPPESERQQQMLTK